MEGWTPYVSSPRFFIVAFVISMRKFRNPLNKFLRSAPVQKIATLLLWLSSTAFSLYVVFEFQWMVFRVYLLFWSENRWGFSVLRQWSSIILIGFWLAFTIITGEYHYQHVREKKSWKVFAWSFGILFLLLVLSWIIA